MSVSDCGDSEIAAALRNGDAELVRSHVAAGVTLSKEVQGAASRGDVVALRLLHDAGADLGQQAVRTAALRGQVDAVDLLVSLQEVDGRHQGALLELAAASGQTAVVQYFLESQRSRRVCIPLHACESAMIKAAEHGHVEIVHLLVREGICVDASDFAERTPLQLAASNGHLAVVEYLLGAGASATHRDWAGRSAIDVAVEHDQLAVLRYFHCAGHNIHETADAHGVTPLHIAARRGREDVMRFLIVEAGADLSARDKEGNTAIHMARRNAASLRLLDELGSVMTDTTIAGATVVHLAAQWHSRPGALRYLHRSGFW